MIRITDLKEPPVVGQKYLVPTVVYPYNSPKAKAWPIFLPKHDDARFFNFEWPHYHADPRFISPTDWKRLDDWETDIGAYERCQRQPVGAKLRGGSVIRNLENMIPLPEIVWRARTCHRAGAPWQFSGAVQVHNMQAHYAGRHCRKLRTGWQCPHQRFPLGSIAPDERGIITCPLHGLRVDARTGLVLDAPPRPGLKLPRRGQYAATHEFGHPQPGIPTPPLPGFE